MYIPNDSLEDCRRRWNSCMIEHNQEVYLVLDILTKINTKSVHFTGYKYKPASTIVWEPGEYKLPVKEVRAKLPKLGAVFNKEQQKAMFTCLNHGQTRGFGLSSSRVRVFRGNQPMGSPEGNAGVLRDILLPVPFSSGSELAELVKQDKEAVFNSTVYMIKEGGVFFICKTNETIGHVKKGSVELAKNMGLFSQELKELGFNVVGG